METETAAEQCTGEFDQGFLVYMYCVMLYHLKKECSCYHNHNRSCSGSGSIGCAVGYFNHC